MCARQHDPAIGWIADRRLDQATLSGADAFFKSVNNLYPGDWQRNRDYIKALARPSKP